MVATLDPMPRTTPEDEKTVGVSGRLNPRMLARLKAIGTTWPYPPTVSQLLAAAVKFFVEAHEDAPADAPAKPPRKPGKR